MGKPTTCIWVSDEVRHKPGCTGTEAEILKALNFGFKKKRDCTIGEAKTKALISFAVAAKLVCTFVLAYMQDCKLLVFSCEGSYCFDFGFIKCICEVESSTYQLFTYELWREKTNNLGFQPGLPQTGLYYHRRKLEA